MAIICLFFGLCLINSPETLAADRSSSASNSYAYTPMEAIPGFGTPTDFPNYVMAVYNFGLWTIGISAMLMIAIGGFMYLTSAGNAAQIGSAKGVIIDAIVGLFLALTSWLLLYTINPDLVKFSVSSSSPASTSQTTTPGTTTPSSSSNIVAGSGEDTIRQQLAKDNISINKSAPATEVNGLRQATIDGVVGFQKDLGSPVTITGGSEAGHEAGPTSHAKGYKVDIRDTTAVNNYISSNYKSVDIAKTGRKDISAAYTDRKGNMYYKESDHWDVCYQCNNVPS